jgi:hypothetical protein
VKRLRSAKRCGVGSNPTRGMNVFVRLFCVYVALCVGKGLARGCKQTQFWGSVSNVAEQLPFHMFMMLSLQRIGKYVGMTSNGITFMPSIVKIGQILSILKLGHTNIETDRQHS